MLTSLALLKNLRISFFFTSNSKPKNDKLWRCRSFHYLHHKLVFKWPYRNFANIFRENGCFTLFTKYVMMIYCSWLQIEYFTQVFHWDNSGNFFVLKCSIKNMRFFMAILWSNLYLIFGKDTLLLILYKFQKIFSFLEISFISQ